MGAAKLSLKGHEEYEEIAYSFFRLQADPMIAMVIFLKQLLYHWFYIMHVTVARHHSVLTTMGV